MWMQVDFLLLLFNSEKPLRTQATSLRCLHFIFSKGMCQSIIGASVIKTLINITDNPELPSTMQCEALQILHKVSPELMLLTCFCIVRFMAY